MENIRCKSDNHVPIVAVSEEPRIPNVPSKPSGDRLRIPGARSPRDWSHEVPEWLQLFEEGVSGGPPRHTMSWWNNMQLSQKRSAFDVRVSSEVESSDLPFTAARSKRPNTSKPTNSTMFSHSFPKVRIVKFASSRRPPELCAGTARMLEETVSTHSKSW